MTEKIICAGFGGQGIMLMRQLLARLGLNRGFCVSWLPAYGAEVRGGTAYCQVIISERKISSPYVERADTCIVMNEPSLLKFEKRLEKNGLLLINSSMVKKNPQRKDVKSCKMPFTELALELGSVKVANSVALGAYIGIKRLFSQGELFKTIEETAPKDKAGLIEINKQAVSRGLQEIKR